MRKASYSLVYKICNLSIDVIVFQKPKTSDFKFFRDANESIQLDEAQTRYELNQIKVDLIQRLDEQQKSHDDHIKAMNEVSCSVWYHYLFSGIQAVFRHKCIFTGR